MSAVLFQPPWFTPVNASGRPYPGARLHLYRAGTTTPVTVYADSSKSATLSNPVVANSAGRFDKVYLDPTVPYNYKAVMTTSLGAQLAEADNIPANPLTADMVGQAIYPRTDWEITAGVTPTNFAYPPGNILRYGTNTTPGTTDMSAALKAAIDVAYAGGGDVYLPAGSYGISSVARTWTASNVGIRIRGDGYSTKLMKIGDTTTPMLDLSATGTGTVSGHFEIDGVHIIGKSTAHDGIRVTRLNRFVLRNSRIDTCDVGLNSVGALVFSVYDSYLNANNVGYKCRKSNSIYANLVQFFGGTISGNSTHGIDLGEGSGVHFYGTDISTNGTAGNAATGGVLIGATVDDESGHAHISFNGCWLEDNLGTAFKCEAATALHLGIRDTYIVGSESGRALDIGAIRHLALENVTSPTTGDTWTLAATNCTIIGGYVYTLADTSTQRTHISLTTSAGAQRFRTNRLNLEHADADEFYLNDDSVVGGSASDTLFRKMGDAELAFRFGASSTRQLRMSSAGVGFYGTAPQAKPTVTGTKDGNAALTDLLSKLASLGLITNSTT
jgi:hypothetical protein